MWRYRSFLGSVAVAAVAVLAAAGAAQAGDFGASAPPSAAGVATTASTAGCGHAPTLTSGTHTIQSSGQNRSYILRVPANYDNSHPYRLVFGFHWVGGTANDVDSGGTDGYNWSYYGLRRLADNAGNGTIFVAPQGNNNGWGNPGGKDVTFTDDMVKQLEASLCVDTAQLFSAGFSYGAAMTYALACARPTVFRAVAVYSGANLSGCAGGKQPIAYMGLHGLRDNVLPIAGGRALRDQFVRNNGCTPQNPPEPAAGSLTHIVTAYTGCKSGYPVVWAAFDGAGHDPGPRDGCTCDGWQTWTSGEVWKFFTQFGSSSTPPPPPPAAAKEIVGAQSGRCVDVADTNGTQAQLADCVAQAASQSWSSASGQLQVYGNKCLDASNHGTSNGTQVIVWDCNGQANQQWTVNANGTVVGTQSNLCLDANGQDTVSGTKLILWSCDGQANQQWSLR